MLIGILGGSFNPPHRGHLALALAVLRLGLVERVCLIPAATPPHKARPGESPETRLAMTRLLAEEDCRVEVDDIELRRDGPSYTIDTLDSLCAAHPDDRFRLVIGSDMAKSFATWREHSRILSVAPPLVAERPDDVFTGEGDFPGLSPEEVAVMSAGRFPMEHVDISSTMVRRMVAEGCDDVALMRVLTPRVLEYVRSRRLYVGDGHLRSTPY